MIFKGGGAGGPTTPSSGTILLAECEMQEVAASEICKPKYQL